MRLRALLSTFLSFACFGCGGHSALTAGSKESIISIEQRALPKNVLDQSVNKGEAKITKDPQGVPALELSIADGSNTEGGFNGAGAGSRAIVGFTGFDEKPLAALSSMAIEVGESRAPVQVLLLVDGECNNRVRVLETALKTGLNILTLDQTLWRYTDTGQTARLSELPYACLRNTDSRDQGLPKIPTASVLLALGSNTSIHADRGLIHRIQIGTLKFDPSTWESR